MMKGKIAESSPMSLIEAAKLRDKEFKKLQSTAPGRIKINQSEKEIVGLNIGVVLGGLASMSTIPQCSISGGPHRGGLYDVFDPPKQLKLWVPKVNEGQARFFEKLTFLFHVTESK